MELKEKDMKIEWLEFENLETGLKIEHIDFFDDITLLVGLSGAGKTQILHATEFSLRLACNAVKVLSPYKVRLGISIGEHKYEWAYTITSQKNNERISYDDADEYIFINESLSCNGEKIFVKNQKETKIEGYQNIPTPRNDKSLIYQYSDDQLFKELAVGIKQLYNIDNDLNIRRYLTRDAFNDLKRKINKEIARENSTNFKKFSHYPTPIKLYITKRYFNSAFNEILEEVKSIFPEIDDIDVVEDEIMDCYCMQIEVYNKKLHQNDISNGMLKTIYFIIDIITASDNSLIMIDEFENGLGMNCISTLSDLLLFKRPDLQFIITSHHPKIIGNIDYNSWKIIERDKNTIKNYDCNDKEYDIGGNRHDAYFKLLDKWEFEGKI